MIVDITKRFVDSLTPDGTDHLYWDRKLPGFGIRMEWSASYVIYRNQRGKFKKPPFGKVGVLTPEEA